MKNNQKEKQMNTLLEFWQTAQIEMFYSQMYCRIDISAIKTPKILQSIKSTLCYDQGKFVAWTHEEFSLLLSRIKESQ